MLYKTFQLIIISSLKNILVMSISSVKPSQTYPVHWNMFFSEFLKQLVSDSLCSSFFNLPVHWSFSQSIDGSIHLSIHWSVRLSVPHWDRPGMSAAAFSPRSLKEGAWCCAPWVLLCPHQALPNTLQGLISLKQVHHSHCRPASCVCVLTS